MKQTIFQSRFFANAFFFGFVFFVALAPVKAQTTAFTYQGRLSDGGQAASGTYDLRFNLFDQAAGANSPLNAQPVTFEDVAVANGVFTVNLNFGANADLLTGADRFLEIAVRPGASTGAFTTLSPRQQITSSPYAIQTLRAATATNAENLGGAAANQYVRTNDARLSDNRAPTANSGNYVQNTAAQQAGTTNFNISGNGTLGGTLAATKVAVAGGVLARGGAPGAFGTNNNGYAFSGNNGDGDGGLFSTANGQISIYTDAVERLRVDSSGNVAVNGGNMAINGGNIAISSGNMAIGATTPNARLDVRGDIKLGADGGLFAAGAAENLRIVRGIIQTGNGAASVFKGTGFTVQRNSAGFYTVNFGMSFSDIPALTVSVQNNARIFVILTEANSTIASFIIRDANNNAIDPSFVHFVAIGPR